MGPTAIASLLTFQAVNGKGPEYAILLCFLSGLVELLMGVFGLGIILQIVTNYFATTSHFALGFLIDFVSGPVSSGFTSAVALIIVTSQVKDVLGIKMSGTTFVDQWISIFKNIHNTRTWDTVLGVVCILILLVMRVSEKLKAIFHIYNKFVLNR